MAEAAWNTRDPEVVAGACTLTTYPIVVVVTVVVDVDVVIRLF